MREFKLEKREMGAIFRKNTKIVQANAPNSQSKKPLKLIKTTS